MNNEISVELEALIPIIEEKLASGGSFCFSPKGISMLPLIRQGTDSVKISPKTGKLKKYDVPLYRRKNGQFVLHRVVNAKDDEYVMCGDNQWELEHGIDDGCIIGVLSQVIKPDRIINITDKKYIIYCHSLVIRRGIKFVVSKAKIIAKHILKVLHLYN